MNRTLYNHLIFEYSRKGRRGFALPRPDHAAGAVEAAIPSTLRRPAAPELPEVDEPTVVRHYTNMSTNNFGVDTGFYPLGSCTMKYNPKINEALASSPAVAALHPAQPYSTTQGALRANWELKSPAPTMPTAAMPRARK